MKRYRSLTKGIELVHVELSLHTLNTAQLRVLIKNLLNIQYFTHYAQRYSLEVIVQINGQLPKIQRVLFFNL